MYSNIDIIDRKVYKCRQINMSFDLGCDEACMIPGCALPIEYFANYSKFHGFCKLHYLNYRFKYSIDCLKCNLKIKCFNYMPDQASLNEEFCYCFQCSKCYAWPAAKVQEGLYMCQKCLQVCVQCNESGKYKREDCNHYNCDVHYYPEFYCICKRCENCGSAFVKIRTCRHVICKSCHLNGTCIKCIEPLSSDLFREVQNKILDRISSLVKSKTIILSNTTKLINEISSQSSVAIAQLDKAIAELIKFAAMNALSGKQLEEIKISFNTRFKVNDSINSTLLINKIKEMLSADYLACYHCSDSQKLCRICNPEEFCGSCKFQLNGKLCANCLCALCKKSDCKCICASCRLPKLQVKINCGHYLCKECKRANPCKTCYDNKCSNCNEISCNKLFAELSDKGLCESCFNKTTYCMVCRRPEKVNSQCIHGVCLKCLKQVNSKCDCYCKICKTMKIFGEAICGHRNCKCLAANVCKDCFAKPCAACSKTTTDKEIISDSLVCNECALKVSSHKKLTASENSISILLSRLSLKSS
jgi:hypothetical protein